MGPNTATTRAATPLKPRTIWPSTAIRKATLSLTNTMRPIASRGSLIPPGARWITSATAPGEGHTQTLAQDIDYLPFGPLKALTYGNGLLETRELKGNTTLIAIGKSL